MLASFQLLAQAQRNEHPVEAEHEQFLQAGRWMRQYDLPRFVFVCVSVEVKLFYLDFESRFMSRLPSIKPYGTNQPELHASNLLSTHSNFVSDYWQILRQSYAQNIQNLGFIKQKARATSIAEVKIQPIRSLSLAMRQQFCSY
jgi:hypothetical protein